MGTARVLWMFVVAAAAPAVVAACGEQLAASPGTPDDASAEETSAGAELIENGLPTKFVQIVAGTSFCPFNPGVSVCDGSSDSHTCALKTDGSIYCWGSNEYGELGHDPSLLTTSTQALPITPPQ